MYLTGGEEVRARDSTQLDRAGAGVTRALGELERVVSCLRARDVQAPLHFDLAELRGYHYHTGITFAAFVPPQGRFVILVGHVGPEGAPEVGQLGRAPV